jgi:putative PIN family toxin of toxin-antitoxin system
VTAPRRVVFDCNIFFQALISPDGPSGRCVTLALDRKVALFCSAIIVDELRETAGKPVVRARFPRITDIAVSTFVENIERVAAFLQNVPERFTYERDPDDAHYVNLALEAGAKYVVSHDNDLLDLMDRSRPEA